MNPERMALWIPLLPLLASVEPLMEKAFGKPGRARSLPRFVALAAGLALPLAVIAVLHPLVDAGRSIRFVLGDWSPVPGIRYLMDGPAWFASAFIALTALCSGVYALARGGASSTFWFLFLLCVYSLQSAILAADFFHLYVCLELMALTSYVLIAYKQEPRALFASFNYLAVSSAAILLYLFGLFLLYGAAGTLSIEEAARVLPAADPRSRAAASLGLAFLAGGLAVRTAVIPFHGWLPDAHASAPHSVSALLSGAMIKVSFFIQWRILMTLDAPWLREGFLWLGAVSASVGVVFALSQSDAKRLLAWHSVSQIGYVLAAFGVGTRAGLLAAGLHAAAHAAFKSLLFLSVGCAVDARGSRNAYSLRGAFRGIPEAGLAFAAGALAIAAIPPFNGSVTKDLVLSSVGKGPVWFLLLAASIGTAASFAKLGLLFFSKPESGQSATPPTPGELRSIRAAARYGALPLAAFCLATGLFAPVLVPALGRILVPGAEAVFAFSLSTGLKNLGVAAAGGVLALGVLSPGGRVLAHAVERIGSNARASMALTLLGIALLAVLGGWNGRGAFGPAG